MTTLSEKTNAELNGLKTTLASLIREQIRDGRPAADLIRFEAAVDSELDRRGA